MEFYFVDRKIQIKHFTDLSFLNSFKQATDFNVEFSKNEIYALQIAMVSDKPCTILRTDLKSKNGAKLTCINTTGVDKFGNSFEQEIKLKKNTIQPLFFMLDAREIRAEIDLVSIEIITDIGTFSLSVNVALTNEEVENNGFDDLWRLSRLSWLNSKAFEDKKIVRPFTPIENEELSFKILGREIELNEQGLPKTVKSFFDEAVELCDDEQCSLLQKPIKLILKNQDLSFAVSSIKNNGNTAVVISKAKNENVKVEITSTLHYEGFIDYKYKITALKDVDIDDVKLSLKLSEHATKYMNGFSAPGGKIKDMTAKFDKNYHHDCIFLGNINTGIRLKLKDENYVKPLINIYYHNQELVIPENTWDNHGNGELNVRIKDSCAKLKFKTGEYSLKKNESHTFSMELHITPFKYVDYKKQYGVRYYHNNEMKNEYVDLKEARDKGLNYMVFHHANRVNPYINYPFVETKRMKDVADEARRHNIGIKTYYTVREHSNHMAETFAYKALGNEIIMRKKGDGMSWIAGGVSPWLKEYFGEEVIPAWRVNFDKINYESEDDVTFLVNPNSRLDNYYIEGLDYLVKKVGIKGIYIDDTALDRTTIERAKKCLDNVNGLIDMHTWNHHEDMAGNCSCVNLYTELFPFIDSGWIGEGFNVKNLDPDFIMTEVALMPYGLGSQMLEGGGDIYVGMLYAMNNRYGWGIKNADIQYKLWDDFGIQESKMLGYWNSQNPIKSSNEKVYVTVYKRDDKALVCMYNFSKSLAVTKLSVNDDKLGFVPNKTAACPEIKRKQIKMKIKLDKPILLGARRGLIFEIKTK